MQGLRFRREDPLRPTELGGLLPVGTLPFLQDSEGTVPSRFRRYTANLHTKDFHATILRVNFPGGLVLRPGFQPLMSQESYFADRAQPSVQKAVTVFHFQGKCEDPKKPPKAPRCLAESLVMAPVE